MINRVYQLDLGILNSTTIQGLDPLLKKIWGKSRICVVVPKRTQGLNIRCKTSEIYFARKALPLVKEWVVGD